MKRYCKEFSFTLQYIKNAILMCLHTRWQRNDVAVFFNIYYPSKSLKEIKEILRNTEKRKSFLELSIPMIANKILLEIKTQSVSFSPIHYQERVDVNSRKVRIIGLTSIKQQIYDYIVVEALKEMLFSKIGTYQCASIKERGCLYGAKAIQRWLRRDPKGTRYFFKCDIKKFYPSVNQNVLKALLSRDVKNKEILYVTFSLIDTYKEGLCIGSYLSQYLANYYLSYAYHFVTETLLYKRRGTNINMVSHALFYMDDIILFSGNKKKLQTASRELERFLKDRLDLDLKTNVRLEKTSGLDINMMGFRITANARFIRKTIYKRIHRLYGRYKNYQREMNIEVARKIISYNGWIANSNSTKLKKKYKVHRVLKRAKECIKCSDILQRN